MIKPLARNPVLIAVTVLIILIGAVLVGLNKFDSRPSTSTDDQSLLSRDDRREVDRQFRGLKQHEFTLGSASAPVKITEFIDIECPYCRNFALVDLPGLISDYVRPGKLSYEIKLVSVVNGESLPRAVTVTTAAKQNRLYPFLHLLFLAEESGRQIDRSVIEQLYRFGQVDSQRKNTVKEQTVASATARNEELARSKGAESFPTFFISALGREPRHLNAGSTDIEMIRKEIDRTLRRHQ